MVITVSLQIWGLLLKEKICSPRDKFFPLRVAPNAEMGLDYLLRMHTLSPLEQNKFSGDCLLQPFIFKLPDFSLTFQVLSKFPWPLTKFPDFSLTEKNFIFQIFFSDQGNPVIDYSSSLSIWAEDLQSPPQWNGQY